MGRTPDPEIERIKNEVDLVRLIEESGVALTRSGDTARGRCPYHPDEHPSLIVTISRQLWRCFPCHIGGSCFDWVMKRDGVSFKHAKEILAARIAGQVPGAGAARRKLPSPVTLDADDRQLLKEVVDYYAQTLAREPGPRDYLRRRGLGDDKLIETFKLGYANRTLAYRLPPKSRERDDDVRGRLQKLGILRHESGHEHLAGSLTIPVLGENGDVEELYGRKIRDDLRKGTPKHLYLARGGRPGRGVFNSQGLVGQEEIILCEALIDALTFWHAGFLNVTSSYGADVFPAEHLHAYKRLGMKRVLIAFDRDDAGDKGAAKVAAQLTAIGIAPYRVLFPHRMDANEYGLKVTPASKSLAVALQNAVWMGQGPPPARTFVEPHAAEEREEIRATAPPEPRPATVAPALAASLPSVNAIVVVNTDFADTGRVEDHPAPAEDVADAEPEPSPSAAPDPTPSTTPEAATVDVPVRIEGDRVEAEIGDRRYLVRGLAKNTSHDLMKVNVKAMRGEAFHVDNLDLYSHRLRQIFQRAVAEELELDENVVKRDLGRVLLALETLRDAALKKTLEPKKAEQVEIPKERKLAALTRLRTPDLIPWIDESLSLCGLVGERTNKVVAYLACVSRLLAKPLAIMVQSSSAAGKSTLMEVVLLLMPPESRVKYSAMTGQALFYMGDTVDLRHKILAIAEEEGASRATYALKLLQSEGELSIVSTGKDPQTGELRSKVYELFGPIMPFVPTTAVDPDEEWENRCIRLAVDEGREQTRRIHEMQRQMMTLEGIVAQQKKGKVVELHHDVQRLLRPLPVRIPYAMRLTFPSHATRTRRDHMKYLGLIQAITLLHQYQRQVKETVAENDEKVSYVDATAEDMELANELANEVLGRSLSELPAQTQALLDQLLEMVTKICAARKIAKEDCRITRREILDHTHLSLTRVRLHLQRLVDYEYVLVHQGARGQSFSYELLYNGEARHRERFMLGLVDVARLKEEGTTPPSSIEVAWPESQLAGGWPAHGAPMAGGWPPPSDGGNGTSGKGSSGSEPRSAKNAKGPKSNGEQGRTRPTPEEGAR